MCVCDTGHVCDIDQLIILHFVDVSQISYLEDAPRDLELSENEK